MKLLKLFRKRKSRKAVSPVVATILLIGIAVSAAVVVYAYTTGMMAVLQAPEIKMSEFLLDDTADTIYVTIQNTGGAEAIITDIIVVGNGRTRTGTAANLLVYDKDTGARLDPGDVIDITLGVGTAIHFKLEENTGGGPDWVSGTDYTITVNISGQDPVSATFSAP